MRPNTCVALSLYIVLLALCGCDTLGLALGTRTRLDKQPVTSLSARLSPEGALAPGGSAHLVLTAATSDGKMLTTVGAGNGPVTFDSFRYEPTVVTVKNGVVRMPADPRLSAAQPPHLAIAVIGHPEVVANLEVPVRYDVAYQADFSGSSGMPGTDGMDGLSGSDGTPGSIDLTNPSPGGPGADGGRGWDGSDGGDGSPGASVQVEMTPQPGTQLLEVRVTGTSRTWFFLIDPNGGSLSIRANGGAGGRGGSGGRGGRGGQGGSGFPPGLSGTTGQSGSDGRQGQGGAAGKFTVTVDPSAQPFMSVLRLTNRNGDGLPGPSPEVRLTPIAPLW